VALLAVACGDDGDAETSASTTTAGASDVTTTSAKAPETGPNTPAPQPLAEREKVTLMYTAPIEPWAAYFLAQQFGEFEKENLDVALEAAAPTDAFVLLGQGRGDMLMAGIGANTLNAISTDVPIKAVAGVYLEDAPQTGYYIRKELLGADGKPDPEKLASARITTGTSAAGFGSVGFHAMYRYLQDIGVPFKDMRIVTVPSTPDVVRALENDQTDVALLNTPSWQAMQGSDKCCVLIPETKVTPAGAQFANTSFLEDRPEVAKAVLRAVLRTQRTYLQGDYHKDQKVLDALATALSQPAETLGALPSLTFDTEFATDTVLSIVPELQAMWIEVGGILQYDTPMPTEEIVDFTYAEEVLAGG
jgi:NitT/TauT family transport system substrate-binding protein